MWQSEIGLSYKRVGKSLRSLCLAQFHMRSFILRHISVNDVSGFGGAIAFKRVCHTLT
jgi:hypothetical protein